MKDFGKCRSIIFLVVAVLHLAASNALCLDNSSLTATIGSSQFTNYTQSGVGVGPIWRPAIATTPVTTATLSSTVLGTKGAGVITFTPSGLNTIFNWTDPSRWGTGGSSLTAAQAYAINNVVSSFIRYDVTDLSLPTTTTSVITGDTAWSAKISTSSFVNLYTPPPVVLACNPVSGGSAYGLTVFPVPGNMMRSYRVDQLEVLKFIPSGTRLSAIKDVRRYSLATSTADITGTTDGQAWFTTDAAGTSLMRGSSTFANSSSTTYYLWTLLKDNGNFDMDPSLNIILDPPTIATKAATTISMTVNAASGVAPATFSFACSARDTVGSVTYSFDFKDDSTSTSSSGSVDHTYTTAGVYSPQCSVTDALGQTRSTYANVYVTNRPTTINLPNSSGTTESVEIKAPVNIPNVIKSATAASLLASIEVPSTFRSLNQSSSLGSAISDSVILTIAKLVNNLSANARNTVQQEYTSTQTLANKNYQDLFSPPATSVQVTPRATALFSWPVAGSTMQNYTVGQVSIMKFIPEGISGKSKDAIRFTIRTNRDDINASDDGQAWFTTAVDHATVLDANTRFESGTNYVLWALIKDDGRFDLDPTPGQIIDPIQAAFVSDASSSSGGGSSDSGGSSGGGASSGGGGGGGCIVDPGAAQSAELPCLLLAGLGAMLRRRWRKR